MPAVLVEVGYLSNADQEKALASGALSGSASRRRSSTPSPQFRAQRRAIDGGRAPAAPAAPQRTAMSRQRVIAIVAIGVVAVGLGWALMVGAVARPAAHRRASSDRRRRTAQTTPADTPAVPRIKANAVLCLGRRQPAGRRSSRRFRSPKARSRRRARSSKRSSRRRAPAAARHDDSRRDQAARPVPVRLATKPSSISTPPCATSTPADR